MKKTQKSPRSLALETLLGAEKMGRYINLATDSSIKSADMSDSDRALFTSLVYGVTERRITLDYIISAMASHGGSHIEPRVRGILRLGLYQLIYMNKIPAHAAVNETVALCKSKGERSFVNAILRNYQRDGHSRVVFPSEKDDKTRYLCVTYSFPKWICASLIRDYGYENAKGILSTFSDEVPSATLRINTTKTSVPEYKALLDKEGISYTDAPYADSALKLEDGAIISKLPGYSEGLFFIQDEASQISTKILAPKPHELIIDTCSCPGSKSFGAAIEMKNEGKIYSFDLHKNKLSLIESSAARLGIDIIETREQDGKRPDETLFGMADRIICDVPCSGLGVMAKKPDIRYKSEEDIAALAPLGLEILSKSADYLKAGGVLLYSTCTLRRDENENTIEEFLRTHEDFTLCPFSLESNDPKSPDIECGGMLTLMPHVHHTDGFFIAKLKKSC